MSCDEDSDLQVFVYYVQRFTLQTEKRRLSTINFFAINLRSSRTHRFQGPVNGYIDHADNGGQATAFSAQHTSVPYDAPRSSLQTTPMATKADYDIYYDQLLLRKRGCPLYSPGPLRSLPIEYRRTGTQIGDIGIVYRSGFFDYLFNILYPADHPINRGRVPGGFTPFDFAPAVREVAVGQAFGPGTYLSSACMRKRTGSGDGAFDLEFIFETSDNEGAVLVLPGGSLFKDLLSKGRLKDYIGQHADQWYSYITGDRGRVGVRSGDLRLVVGFDQAHSWGIATFACCQEPGRLEFKRRMLSGSFAYTWHCPEGIGNGKSGPPDDEIQDLRQSTDEPPPINQTIFVRSMNFTLRGEILDDRGSVSLHVRSSSMQDGSNTPVLFRGDSSLHPAPSNSQPSSSIGGSQGTQQRGVNFLSAHYELPVIHPSAYLNQFLLDKYPNAKIAITDDWDWISVVRDDDDTFPSSEDLCQRIIESCQISEENGIVTISTSTAGVGDNSSTLQPDLQVTTLDPARPIVDRSVEKALGRVTHELRFGPAARIAKAFGDDAPTRQSRLDCIYDSLREGTSTQPQHLLLALKKDCRQLLECALPSQLLAAQIQSFRCIIALTTRYPVLRRVFLQSADGINVADSPYAICQLWQSTEHRYDVESHFTLEFAAHCLASGYTNIGVEDIRPSELGCIGEEGLGVVDRLVMRYCDGGSGFPRLIAIRYLAGILELPAFWSENYEVQKFTMDKLCKQALRLVCDINSNSVTAEHIGRLALLDPDGVDELAEAVLVGGKGWIHSKPQIKGLGSHSWLTNFVKLIKVLRGLIVPDLLPMASRRAAENWQLPMLSLDCQYEDVERVDSQLANSSQSTRRPPDIAGVSVDGDTEGRSSLLKTFTTAFGHIASNDEEVTPSDSVTGENSNQGDYVRPLGPVGGLLVEETEGDKAVLDEPSSVLEKINQIPFGGAVFPSSTVFDASTMAASIATTAAVGLASKKEGSDIKVGGLSTEPVVAAEISGPGVVSEYADISKRGVRVKKPKVVRPGNRKTVRFAYNNTYSRSITPSSAGPSTGPSIGPTIPPNRDVPRHLPSGARYAPSSPTMQSRTDVVFDAIRWNLLDPPSMSILDREPASELPFAVIRISFEHLPWTCKVVASNGHYVTVSDVLDSVYRSLRTNINQTEFEALSEEDRRRATRAYQERYRRYQDRKREEEKRRGLKRVDFLMGRTQFAGLSAHKHRPQEYHLWVTKS